MERTTYLKYRLRFPRIYRAELEKIQQILTDVPKEYNCSMSYTIQASKDIHDEYKAKDIADIPEDTKVEKLRIFGHYKLPDKSENTTAYFSLWQDRRSIKIDFTNPDTLLRGKFDEIKDVLKKTEHPRLWLILGHPWIAYWFWMVMYWVSFPFMPRHSHHYQIEPMFVITGSITALGIILFIASIVTSNMATRLSFRSKASSFIGRNREQMVAQALSSTLAMIFYAILAAVALFFIGRLTKR